VKLYVRSSRKVQTTPLASRSKFGRCLAAELKRKRAFSSVRVPQQHGTELAGKASVGAPDLLALPHRLLEQFIGAAGHGDLSFQDVGRFVTQLYRLAPIVSLFSSAKRTLGCRPLGQAVNMNPPLRPHSAGVV